MPKASHTLSLTPIMRKAWRLARSGAARFGGRVSLYFNESLRLAWAEAKRVGAEVVAMRQRVLVEVEAIKAEARAHRQARDERLVAAARAVAAAKVVPFPAVAAAERRAEGWHEDWGLEDRRFAAWAA